MIRMKLSMFVVLIGASLTLSGCGKSVVSVSGKVVNGGKEYTPADGDMNITLAPQGGGTENGSGKVEENGTFTITSASGSGVPAGQYKVSVTRYPSKTNAKPGSTSSPKTLTLPETWDVSSSNSTFTLDLAKLK